VALDTTYRPRKYGDVLGQDSSVRVLRQLLKEGKGYHQSYVFCGQHGSGKTTMGRILARALLCSAPVDGEPCDSCESCLAILQGKQHECFTELDAATKSTKEDMLKITEDIQYSSFSGKRRIYLFDESHRLSKSALDAVLKPMEDCIPGTQDKQLICIFCTTEPEKMQSTIFSRCAPAFVIKAVTPEGIADRLAWVCAQEGIAYEHDALVTIAEVTECHIRDALKTLEGVSVLGPVSRTNVTSYLGLGSNDLILDLLDSIGVDQASVVRAASALADSTSPTSAYERLAEASITAYRAHIGVGKIQAHWPQDRIKALAEKGAQLLALSSRFSAPPKRPTSHTLLLDSVALHNGVVHGVSSEAVIVSVAKATPTVVSAVAEKVMPAGNVGINAPKPSANAVVQVDPRAVGGGAASRRVQNSTSVPATALDADAFRNLVGFHYRRLTGAGTGST
jgi:DNA polymerase III subunit gamma/tau